MAWLALLALMVIVAAAPGISMYVEYLRRPSPDTGEALSERGPQ